MGSWSIWHFIAFIVIAIAAAWLSRKNATDPPPRGLGGWLLVLIIFLLFWAAQELAEFYRVKAQVETLIPSARDSRDYLEYMQYAAGIAWFQAALLIACALLLAVSRGGKAIAAAIAALWLGGPIMAGIEFAMAESYFGEYLLEKDYSSLAATTLFATIWTWYLLASRRVKNTYR